MTIITWITHLWDVIWPVISFFLAAATAVFAVVKAWPWVRSFVKTVDVVSTLPSRLDGLEKANSAKLELLVDLKSDLTKVKEELETHVTSASADVAWWNSMKPMMERLVPMTEGIQQTLVDVHHEVRPNDGSSMKDAVARIEGQLTEQARVTGEHNLPKKGTYE